LELKPLRSPIAVVSESTEYCKYYPAIAIS
jgi:hypothetical protein